MLEGTINVSESHSGRYNISDIHTVRHNRPCWHAVRHNRLDRHNIWYNISDSYTDKHKISDLHNHGYNRPNLTVIVILIDTLYQTEITLGTIDLSVILIDSHNRSDSYTARDIGSDRHNNRCVSFTLDLSW